MRLRAGMHGVEVGGVPFKENIMSRSIHKIFFAVLAGLGLLLGAGSAAADAVYTLGVGNSAVSGYPAPYGTVTVHLTSSTTATLTFTTDSVGQYTYVMVDGGAMAANGSFTATGTPYNIVQLPGFAGTSFSSGAGNLDSIGTFSVEWDNTDSYDHAFTSAMFNITATGSTTWVNAFQVLTANDKGYLAGIHLAVCDTSLGTCNPSIPAPATGFAAANGTLQTVPIPAAAWLFGSGLLGLIAVARRRIAGNQSPAFA
jgi:hypothetical protein